MRVIKIAGGILLCILAVIAAYSQKYNFDGLLLAVPKQSGANGINIETLKDLDILLTYEVRSTTSVKAINYHTVELIQTNHSYPFLTGYNIINGGFFTKDAEEKGLRTICLNKKAAFELFGDINIIGNEVLLNRETYVITGVLDDGNDDSLNAYTPLADGSPNIFLIYAENKDYTINELNSAGFSNYEYIELNTLSNAVREKTEAAFAIYIAVFAIILIRKRFFTISALFGLFSWVFTRHTEAFMKWEINSPLLWDYANDSFIGKITFLQNIELYSNIFLASFIIVMTAILLQGVRHSIKCS